MLAVEAAAITRRDFVCSLTIARSSTLSSGNATNCCDCARFNARCSDLRDCASRARIYPRRPRRRLETVSVIVELDRQHQQPVLRRERWRLVFCLERQTGEQEHNQTRNGKAWTHDFSPLRPCGSALNMSISRASSGHSHQRWPWMEKMRRGSLRVEVCGGVGPRIAAKSPGLITHTKRGSPCFPPPRKGLC